MDNLPEGRVGVISSQNHCTVHRPQIISHNTYPRTRVSKWSSRLKGGKKPWVLRGTVPPDAALIRVAHVKINVSESTK